MFSQSRFRISRGRFLRPGSSLSLALLLSLAAVQTAVHRGHAAGAAQRGLSFEERVTYQRAIEEVWWRHRLWPKDNPQPKPTLDEVMPEAAIRTKVEDYLRQSQALENYWQRPLTGKQLQAELDRIARDTRQPEVLGELWAALGNDPFVIAECLARPLLAERLARESFAADGRWPSERKTFDEWRRMAREEMAAAAVAPGYEYQLPVIAAAASQCESETWAATSFPGAPGARSRHTAVWTGSEMIIWGGFVPGPTNTGSRYRPATDSWSATSLTNAPPQRHSHTAVWTGSEMIVWGGRVNDLMFTGTNTGGRYNPATDTWTATNTSGAPSERDSHTAVWTGSQMIIWGGSGALGGGAGLELGGRYNPAADAWAAVSTTNSPGRRTAHTAVWTGGEMIVWGGVGSGPEATGRRYNPATDSWVATSLTGAPSGRSYHTAVWTGSEMIVWGGSANSTYFNSGSRYNPVTDAWTATNTSGTPAARDRHTAVWTGSEMIVWGGSDGTASLNSGRRYNPATDEWVATSITDAPGGRVTHTAVWAGSTLIVWGGGNNSLSPLNTGGRYSVASTMALSPTNQPFPATGGSGNISVTAPGGCNWTTISNANWLTATSGGSGSGNGTVAFNVAATTVSTARTGTITVGNQTFTVTQAAGNPVPMLDAFLSPMSVRAGGAGFTLTVNGSNFVSNSVVRWNGADRPTTFVGSTRLTIAVPAADIALPQAVNVTVSNPAPGGGVSNPAGLTVCGYSVAPSGQFISEDGGTGSFQVSSPGTPCIWNARSNVDWIQITAGGTGVFVGTVSYTVSPYAVSGNAPRTGTITVDDQTFTVTQMRQATTASAASYSRDALASESIVSAFGKNLANATQPATSLPLPTALGGTSVRVKDSLGTERLAPLFYVSPLQVNYQIPPGTAQGSATVTVTTGDGIVSMDVVTISALAPGVFAANADGRGVLAGYAQRFRPDSPPPTLTSLSPTSATPGGAAFTLTVNGTNFVPESIVRWNGGDRATTYVSSMRLTAAITAADVAAAGTAAVTVFTPAPGGGLSAALNFTLSAPANPVPTLSSLSHSTTTSGGPGFTLTVNGSGFVPASVVRWNGQDKATTFVSAARLTAQVVAADVAAPGEAQVAVFNPGPGGGVSASQRIDIFDGNGDVRLSSGTTFNGSFGLSTVNACSVRIFPQYTIQVPAGASQLRVELNGTTDVDLYVRFGQRVDTPNNITADYKADGLGSSETITVTASSSPPLQAGTYFIAVGKCGINAATFTLTATVTPGSNAEAQAAFSPDGLPRRLLTANLVDYFFGQPVGRFEAAGRGAAAAGGQTFAAAETQTVEPVLRFDAAQNRYVPLPLDLGPDRGAASDQVYLILFGTGLRARSDLSAVTVTVGGVAAQVTFAGAQGEYVGLDQINVLLPRALVGRGVVDVVLRADGKTANTVQVAIK